MSANSLAQIMHAEMPRQNPDGSANVGMQLWVDLPQKLKKCEPRYRDLRASEIPNIDIDDGKVHIKVISGQSHGVDSVKDLAYTPVWILDSEIKPGGKITQNLPEGWNAFAYTLSGSTTFGVGKDRTTVGQFHNIVFEQKGDTVTAEVAADARENGRICKPPGSYCFGFALFVYFAFGALVVCLAAKSKRGAVIVVQLLYSKNCLKEKGKKIIRLHQP